MPKVNIESPFEASPRVEVGWSKGSGHVQITVSGTTSLDRIGTDRLIRALNQAREQAFGKAEPTLRAPRPAVISRNHELSQALA